MSVLPESHPIVSPGVQAGLLLAAVSQLEHLELAHPSVTRILEATGSGRTQAYEYRDRILESLPGLSRPAGRPRVERPQAAPESSAAVSEEVLGFLMEHPGAASRGRGRQWYSDGFRQFVLELYERHCQLGLERFAAAVQVPASTLRQWLAAPSPEQLERPVAQARSEQTPDLRQTQIETVLAAFKTWKGAFTDFCDHVALHLHLPFGRTFIAGILSALGARDSRRRGGRSPDERALRGAFATFFAGAEWIGDGTEIVVRLFGQRFSFNVELLIDAHTGAATGASLRDEEDAEAVLSAFLDAVRTTGSPPLAVLLDNRPSNHAPEVEQALAPASVIPATPARPQNKAHVEGAFGLFAQTSPELVFDAATPRELAAQVLRVIVTVWARTLNHRPRRDRAGRSRTELYRMDKPTAAEVMAARDALRQRLVKQRKARETFEARRRPEVRAFVAAAFERLGLTDPKGSIQAALCRYGLESLLAGLATFEGKKNAGTLPEGAEGRYLLGIVRNIAEYDEGIAIAEALLAARLELQDAALAGLQQKREHILAKHDSPVGHLCRFLDAALDTDRRLDRQFWVLAAADIIRQSASPQPRELFRLAARRILARYRVTYAERQAVLRSVARHAFPIA